MSKVIRLEAKKAFLDLDHSEVNEGLRRQVQRNGMILSSMCPHTAFAKVSEYIELTSQPHYISPNKSSYSLHSISDRMTEYLSSNNEKYVPEAPFNAFLASRVMAS